MRPRHMDVIHTALARPSMAILSLLFLLAGVLSADPASAGPDQAPIDAAARASAKGDLPGGLDLTYPIRGTVFPPEIPAPMALWKDSTEGVDAWVITVALEGRPELITALTREQKWRPDREAWDAIKEGSKQKGARLTVVGIRCAEPGKIRSGARTVIHTSTDEVGAPIFYREVPLPFIYAVNNPETIRWRMGEVGSEKQARVVLEDLPVCGNCHSFSKDGSVLGMDVDYANDKGSYVIAPVEKQTLLKRDRIITWSDYRREDGKTTFGLLSQVSPDGRYVVSTVKDLSVFVPKDDLEYSQLFFPLQGILVVYDRERKEFLPLPGADDPKYVQSNPTWSPDGEYLIFTRSMAISIPEAENSKTVLLARHLANDFIEGRRQFRYDLCRIPFNGGKGGTPEPIPGASGNGKSNYFPRISPDGKWLVFTQAESFMLLQPDSRLFIVPVEGGEPREMACNTPNMNSWHSWSPNGKWLVFSSKARGLYTQLYLTHVDEDGRDAPPVFLENFRIEKRAANIPEFINTRPDKLERIVEQFLDDFNLQRQADQLVKYSGQYAKSLKHYRRALRLNPKNITARINLGMALTALGQMRIAEQEFQNVLKLDPAQGEALNNLASIYGRTGRLAEATQTYEKLLRSHPDNAIAHLNLGWTYYNLGKFDDAEDRFRKVLRLEPESPKAHLNLGLIADKRGEPRDALDHYRKALNYVPELTADQIFVVQTLMGRRELKEEMTTLLEKILKEKPKYLPAHELLRVLSGKQSPPGPR